MKDEALTEKKNLDIKAEWHPADAALYRIFITFPYV
jgi:hypothetical protein